LRLAGKERDCSVHLSTEKPLSNGSKSHAETQAALQPDSSGDFIGFSALVMSDTAAAIDASSEITHYPAAQPDCNGKSASNIIRNMRFMELLPAWSQKRTLEDGKFYNAPGENMGLDLV